MTPAPQLLFALGGCAVVFAAAFVVARRLNNYGLVDIVWSYAFAGVTVFYALVSDGAITRRLLLATLVTLWSLRLGTHLAIRVSRHHPEEDARYGQLRREWTSHFALRMFGFFQLQAVSVVLLTVGFPAVMAHARATLHPLEAIAAVLWLVAILGEATADAQLAAFKRDAAQRGRVCNVGLWRYSRHPNYFFEWLIWVAYGLFALASPHGWIELIGPIVMYLLLVRVTGIPLAEAQSLRSKGDAYRAYQRTTSAFVPWPPRGH